MKTKILGNKFPKIDDDVDLDRRIDISQELPSKKAIWSIFETVDIMDQVAIKGTGLQVMYDIHWGEDKVMVALPDDPTWNDLLAAGDKAICLSGDFHHVYIEDFTRVNAKTIRMLTGS